MNPAARITSSIHGRAFLYAIGGAYVGLGIAWPAWLSTQGSPLRVGAIIATVVVGCGISLSFGTYRLPQRDIHPDVYPTITRWCLRAIGLIGLLVVALEVAVGVTDPGTNLLILTALGAIAGFAAGRHDARAKSRAYTLEQRNEELQEAKADLEATVEQLEESDRRYRTVTENFPNGAVALLDEELRHQLIAGKGFDKLDFDAEDLQGERIHDLYEPDVLEVIEQNYTATLNGEQTTFEVEVDGRLFEFRTHPLTDTDGNVTSMIAMSQDITERKLHEQELAKQARQQEVVAELGQYALETDDLDALMAEAARRVADALGNEYCKVVELDERGDELRLRQGAGWNDGIVGNATVSAHEADSQAAYTLQTDDPVVVEDLHEESRFSGPDLLTDHAVRSGISVQICPFNEAWGILGTHDTARREFTDEDVSFVQSVANILAEAIGRHQYQSDLEATVADLEESNKRLEQFAYAASHDLQEPLRMVSSYLQLIEKRYADDLDESGQEYIDYAVDGAARMREMIHGLLEYSRVETQGTPFQTVDLNDVVADVRADLQVTIAERDADIHVDDLPRVRGDEGQLGQVFQNLIRNAITYTEDGAPQIHITADRSGNEWEIAVQDEGIGIDPAHQDRVFDIFQRLHTQDEYSGSGIGLALCQRIIERHGGDIWVGSEPGEGSTFSFTLPAAQH